MGTAKISRLNNWYSFDTRPISWFLLLAGFSFCLGSVFGLTKAFCVSEGCKLYQGYSFLGLSLYVWGSVAFGAALIFSVWSTTLYRRFLYLCLCAEIILLTYQVVYLPCSECMLVGLLWGLLSILEIGRRVPVKIWSALFLIALVLLAKEMMNPWPVYGQSNASMKVYFSPSCPACQQEIKKLLASGEVDRGQVAFFPVALRPGDIDRVNVFQQVLDHTLDVDLAFQSSWSGDDHVPTGWRNWLKVRLGLIRNRLVLSRMGVSKIPVVVIGSVGALNLGGSADNSGCGLEGGNHCAELSEVHKAGQVAGAL